MGDLSAGAHDPRRPGEYRPSYPHMPAGVFARQEGIPRIFSTVNPIVGGVRRDKQTVQGRLFESEARLEVRCENGARTSASR